MIQPLRTIVTSFNPRKTPVSSTSAIVTGTDDAGDGELSEYYDQGDWVLCLTSSTDTLACALSNGEVQIYDQARLHVVQTFSRGPPVNATYSTAPPTLTSLVYHDPSTTNTASAGTVTVTATTPSQSTSTTCPSPLLWSTDTAGCLAVMDTRQGQRCIRTTLPSPGLCMDVQGPLAAVGSTRGQIHFCDLRQPGSVLGTYVDSHTHDVTSVTFSPAVQSCLVSGAEDGLLNLFDIRQPTEDRARQAICNVGPAVRHTGFCGNNAHHLFCLTGSETLSFWDASSTTVTCVRDYGYATRSLAAGKTNTGNSSSVDYLVDAVWDATTNGLRLLAGTSTGDLVVCHVTPNSDETRIATNDHTNDWQIMGYCQGGHRGVVRAWTTLKRNGLNTNNNNGFGFITAGEDARLCEWNIPLQSSSMIPTASRPTAKRPSWSGGTGTGGGGPQRRRQRVKPNGASPY
jgi:WD40 repeat protein